MLLWVFLAFCPILTFGDNCSAEEKLRLKTKHKQCTNTVQERYSILTVVPQDSKQIISTPLAYKAGDGTNSGLSKDHVCSMIEETIKQCSRIYDHCFSEAEMRQFKDTQIQLISEIMEQVYNMGSVVAECEVMLEFERSGREHMVLPTNKCKLEQVKAVSAKYQKCIEGANEAMNGEIIQHSSVERILDALCDGMNMIVHQCAEHLYTCYTHEEINETKVGQLELTKQIFKELMRSSGEAGNSVVVDLGKCSAYKTMYYNGSNKTTNIVKSTLFLSTIITILSAFYM